MSNLPQQRPPRQAVLVVSHPDGYCEVFAEPGVVDAMIVRVPVAHSREAEVVAEDFAELTMPPRYRQLYRRDYLRANGTTRPLTVDALLAATWTLDVCHSIDQIPKLLKRGAA